MRRRRWQPKDEILLTGITSIGTLHAYFMSKPPQGKQPDFYSLGVDEKRDGLEVLGIDLANKSAPESATAATNRS